MKVKGLNNCTATYKCDGISSGENYDVAARNGCRAHGFQQPLGFIDDIESAERSVRGIGPLCAVTLDQHRRVASLRSRKLQCLNAVCMRASFQEPDELQL